MYRVAGGGLQTVKKLTNYNDLGDGFGFSGVIDSSAEVLSGVLYGNRPEVEYSTTDVGTLWKSTVDGWPFDGDGFISGGCTGCVRVVAESDNLTNGL